MIDAKKEDEAGSDQHQLLGYIFLPFSHRLGTVPSGEASGGESECDRVWRGKALALH